MYDLKGLKSVGRMAVPNERGSLGSGGFSLNGLVAG